MLRAERCGTKPGALSGFRRDADPSQSSALAGARMAPELSGSSPRTVCDCVLARIPAPTRWLAFYLPEGYLRVQPTRAYRWVNLPIPDRAMSASCYMFDEARPSRCHT